MQGIEGLESVSNKLGNSLMVESNFKIKQMNAYKYK